MKLTHIAATLISMRWGKHIATAPAIASMTQQALQEAAQLRKKQKEFRRNGASQVKEL